MRAVFWTEPTGSRHCDGSNSDDKSNLEEHVLSLSAQVCKQRNVLDIWQFMQSLMVRFCFQPFPTSQNQTKEPLFNQIEPFSYLKPNQFISVSLIFKKTIHTNSCRKQFSLLFFFSWTPWPSPSLWQPPSTNPQHHWFLSIRRSKKPSFVILSSSFTRELPSRQILEAIMVLRHC